MELRQTLTRLEKSLSYYWSHPHSDQAQALAELRAALNSGDRQQLQDAGVEVRQLLGFYWSLPNTGQAELLAELDQVLQRTSVSAA